MTEIRINAVDVIGKLGGLLQGSCCYMMEAFAAYKKPDFSEFTSTMRGAASVLPRISKIYLQFKQLILTQATACFRVGCGP
jgi:hypothetical protein